jgi:hypothetical protein
MAARIWFTSANTPPDVDLAILNRAARILRDMQHDDLDRATLVAIRCAYRPGLSAEEIARIADDALGYH